MMIAHHIKVALRSIRKQGWFAFINVAGLSIGVAISVMILLLVKYELSYDTHFSDSESIFRYTTKGVIGTDVINGAPTPMPLAKLLHDRDEVQDVTRIYLGSNKLIAYDEKKFGEELFFFGDSSFFKIFDLKLIAGEYNLKDPGNVVISRSIAKKYFGYADPIGKSINREDFDFKVVGICEDMPEATHFHFDFMASMNSIDEILKQKGDSSIAESWHNDWLDLKCYTYLKLREDVQVDSFQIEINKQKDEFVTAQLNKFVGDKKQQEILLDFYLQPIRDVHLFSDLDNELEANSSLIYINLLVFTAALILLITCVNFVNLTTSKAKKRFKEVGVRKILGANRKQLVLQFLFEAIIYSVSAMFIGLVLLELFLPVMNVFFGLDIEFLQVHSLMDLFWILLIVVLVGILIGSYPAFFFSGRRSDNFLSREDSSVGKLGYFLRGFLVSFQVAVTVFIIAVTAGMWWQINYVQTVDLGYQPENILVIKRARSIGHEIGDFKADVKRISGVSNVAGCWYLPGDDLAVTPFEINKNGKTEVIKLSYIVADNEYFETLGLSLKAGRFLGGNLADTMGVVLNDAAVKEFNIRKPLGERLGFFGVKDWDMTVVGVMRDFHFQSLHNKIQPQAVFMTSEYEKHPFLMIRFNEGINAEDIQRLEMLWMKYTDGSPFEWEILEDKIADLYNEDIRIAKITAIISVLAMFMTVLGIIALSSFISEFKARPISIKKVLGASRQAIMLNVFSVFGVYIISGVVMALVPVYIALMAWAKRFAYFDLMPIVYFLLIAIAMVGIVFVAIFYQVYKFASDKPLGVWQYE